MAASTSEMSTFRTYLMYKAPDSDTYTKLVDIISSPDTGGTPNMIEITTLSDKKQRFVPGIEQTGDGYAFTANYILSDYMAIDALSGVEHDYALWFGGTGDMGATAVPTGDDGKFPFKGILSVFVNGAEVDAARQMTITIAPTEPMALDMGTGFSDATLAGLTISGVALSPAFTSSTTSYTAETTTATNKVTATTNDSSATVAITVGGTAIANKSNATWTAGSNTLTVVVTAGDGTTTKTYTVTVTKS